MHLSKGMRQSYEEANDDHELPVYIARALEQEYIVLDELVFISFTSTGLIPGSTDLPFVIDILSIA